MAKVDQGTFASWKRMRCALFQHILLSSGAMERGAGQVRVFQCRVVVSCRVVSCRLRLARFSGPTCTQNNEIKTHNHAK